MRFSVKKCKRSVSEHIVGSTLLDKTYYIDGFAVKINSTPMEIFADIFIFDDDSEMFSYYGEAHPNEQCTGYLECRHSILENIINHNIYRVEGDNYND